MSVEFSSGMGLGLRIRFEFLPEIYTIGIGWFMIGEFDRVFLEFSKCGDLLRIYHLL